MKTVLGLLLVAFCLLPVGAIGAERVAAPAERAYSAFNQDKNRQFDFWIGEWDVNLKILQKDLTFKDSVRAHTSIYSILGGKAILELWDSKPIKGYSLRYFDAASDQWVLWLNWPGKNRSTGSSLTGNFQHGRGNFLSEYENQAGETIIQRYSFNDITPFSLRWDDLSSKDGGKTWSKNWLMEFERSAIDPKWPIDPGNTPTFETGVRCDDESFRPYEVLAGHWEGEVDAAAASLDAYRVLDGCALVAFLDIDSTPSKSRFFFLTFNTAKKGWETSFLDQRSGVGLVQFVSQASWNHGVAEEGELSWKVTGGALSYERTTTLEDGTTQTEEGRFSK
jgi:hypothetical protein